MPKRIGPMFGPQARPIVRKPGVDDAGVADDQPRLGGRERSTAGMSDIDAWQRHIAKTMLLRSQAVLDVFEIATAITRAQQSYGAQTGVANVEAEADIGHEVDRLLAVEPRRDAVDLRGLILIERRVGDGADREARACAVVGQRHRGPDTGLAPGGAAHALQAVVGQDDVGVEQQDVAAPGLQERLVDASRKAKVDAVHDVPSARGPAELGRSSGHARIGAVVIDDDDVEPAGLPQQGGEARLRCVSVAVDREDDGQAARCVGLPEVRVEGRRRLRMQRQGRDVRVDAGLDRDRLLGTDRKPEEAVAKRRLV